MDHRIALSVRSVSWRRGRVPGIPWRLPLSSLVAVSIASGLHFMPAHAAPWKDQRLVQESWTFRDGAPEVPTAFAQTADGHLWVGSAAGLFRFDGVRFELFRSPFGDALRSTSVSSLLAADGGLWVGYLFGGFSFVKNGRVRNFSEPTATVNGFARDDRGIIWAGSHRTEGPGGLWRFDGSSWQRVGTEWNVPSRPVGHLGFDREGILWVLTGWRAPEHPKELYFLKPGEKRFRKAADSLLVLGFTRDADGRVVTTQRESRTDPGASQGSDGPLPAYPVLRMQSTQILDRTNAVWVFSERTLHRHAGGERPDEIVEKAAPGNSEAMALNPISDAILVDREGSLWMATQEGVHRFSYSPLIEVALPKQPAPWFTLATGDGGVVWVAGGDGVGKSTLFRISGGKVDLQKSIAGVSSFAYRAPDGAFWFGGEGGLWRMTGDRLAKVDLPPEVSAQARAMLTMTHDGSGGAWVSFAGLGLYRLKDGAWTKYAGPRDGRLVGGRRPCGVSAVLAAFTDATGRVWLGCQRDLLTVLDADGERIYGSGDGLQVGNVTAIHGRGPAIWIGGESGLQRFDKGRFQAIRTEGDETLRGISGIVETPNGDLWVNGLGGIVHIRQAEIRKALVDPAYRVAVSRFDRRSGLPGFPSQLRRLPTAIEGTDGRLWFTVSNGVVWLDPAAAYGETAPPPVSIHSIEVDDKVHEPGRLPDFPPGTSSIRIGYAAVSLLHPEAIRFRYRLRDADPWHDAAHATSVSYRDLPPGTYRFQVAASDANGVWSGNVATTQFTILPAFHQTRWFRTASALLLVLLAWVGYRLRIRSLRRQFEATLEARVGERTRIARDLHDTLLQSFHGLLLRFQTAMNLLPDRPAESRQVLAGAIDQAAEAITEGRDAVQGLRSSATETNDLVDSLRSLAEGLRSEDGGDASLHIDVQGTPRALHPIVRDEVFRIAGEALRNAFRHAGAKQIEVELRYDKRLFRLRVRDDGKGIDPEVLHIEGREGHFGLRGMRERAKVAGGKLTVWSAPRAGTELELSIPAPHAYSTSRSDRP